MRVLLVSTIFCAFFGHRMWLRRMCSHCLRASCHSCTGPRGQDRVNPLGGCSEFVQKLCSVQLPCSLRSLCTEIVQSLCGFRTEAGRRWCGDRAAAVPFLSVRPPRGARAGIVQYQLRHVYGLRTYNFFKFV